MHYFVVRFPESKPRYFACENPDPNRVYNVVTRKYERPIAVNGCGQVEADRHGFETLNDATYFIVCTVSGFLAFKSQKAEPKTWADVEPVANCYWESTAAAAGNALLNLGIRLEQTDRGNGFNVYARIEKSEELPLVKMAEIVRGAMPDCAPDWY